MAGPIGQKNQSTLKFYLVKLIFFAHPAFMGYHSMRRFVSMLADGMKARGHQVEVWAPKAHLSRLTLPQSKRKWLGYVDKYVLFPREVRSRLKDCSPDTLFVITDNALGLWVPLVADRPHVIHCHDFLAQRSAQGIIPEKSTGWTGRQYQAYVHRGYSKAKNFISVSTNTQYDLHESLGYTPLRSAVVYNGLSSSFHIRDPIDARATLGAKMGLNLSAGYLLHVGNNFWYKNRKGVIDIYDAWRRSSQFHLPLVLIGPKPDAELSERFKQSAFRNDIHLLSGIEDADVCLAYAGASLVLFPSLAEGFGWPIAEAMASGCPVITTDESPMTEVAGNAAFLVPRRPNGDQQAAQWALKVAEVVVKILVLSSVERREIVEAGLINIQRFDSGLVLNRIESIYQTILQTVESPESTR